MERLREPLLIVGHQVSCFFGLADCVLCFVVGWDEEAAVCVSVWRSLEMEGVVAPRAALDRGAPGQCVVD